MQLTQPKQNMASARRKTLKQNLIAYSFILPNLLGFALFTLVPVVFSLVLALMNWDGANVVTWAGLDNFRRLLHDETFRISLFNTFYYVIGTVPLTMAASLGLALLLNQPLQELGIRRSEFGGTYAYITEKNNVVPR